MRAPIVIQSLLNEEVGFHSIAGFITTPGMAVILARALQFVDESGLHSSVVDYRQADFQTNGDALTGVARKIIDRKASAGLRIPTALVVKPEQLEFWRRYAYNSGMAGIMRAAFTCHDDAIRWASAQAALRAAQAAHRRRGQ